MSNVVTMFGRGTFANKPASPNAGWLYFATDEGILYRYSGSAWEGISHPGLVYAFSTTTTDADPGVGTLRFNHATPASVTIIYIDDSALSVDADLGTVFDALTGARILVSQADDPAKYLLGEVTADADGAGYWKLTVTVDSSGSLIDNNALCTVQILGGGGSGGGAASVNWWDSPNVNIISKMTLKDGNIVQSNGLLAALLSGTADGDGDTGAGGFTESQVACSCAYDTTPALSTIRGYNIFDVDTQIGTGQYMRTSVRFPEENDQNLFVLFATSSWFNDGGLTNASNVIGLIRRHGTDTNWQVCHNDGATNQTYVDTGVAWATGNWLNVEIYIWDAGGGTMNAKVWINGVLVATVVTNLPAATLKTLRPQWGTYFQSGGATATYDAVMFTNEIFWASEDEGVLDALGWATL